MTTATLAAPDTTWTLVQRVQAGDTQAFAPIYTSYRRQVFSFVHYRVGYNTPLAEDLTSETFTKALRNIHSFTWQGRDFGAWLITIARNLVADYFKSCRYRLEVMNGDELNGVDRTDTSPEGRPAEAVADHLTNLDLLRLLDDLAPDQRDVIVLRFLRGLSTAETALVMGKGPDSIKALQYRATRALARAMAGGAS